MSASPTPIGHDALRLAVQSSGSLARLARAIGVRYQLIQSWLGLSRKFATPARYVLAIERETGMSRHLLRPDVFGSDTGLVTRPVPPVAPTEEAQPTEHTEAI